REGVAPDRIERVGNIMIDALEMMRPRIESLDTARAYGHEPGGYGVVTLHRPSNVDQPDSLAAAVDAVVAVANEVPLVFPVHPRTRARLECFGLAERLERCAAIAVTPPLGYLGFMSLMMSACLVVTDSGGVQEETTYLGIPC